MNAVLLSLYETNVLNPDFDDGCLYYEPFDGIVFSDESSSSSSSSSDDEHD